MSRSTACLLAVITCAGAGGAAGAAGAGAVPGGALHTQSATAGGVAATFTYRGAIPTTSGAHLKIARDGRTLYDRPVTAVACGSACAPGRIGRGSSSVGIVPLLPGSPQVVLELYSGGANCCFVDQVFSYDTATSSYVKTEHNFASSGAVLKALSGRWRFVSADPGFKYAFTDGADSGEPIQIWGFTATGFADVTRAYPALIRRDAAFWLRTFRHHLANGVGLIAAWAADEELLGRDRLVQSTLTAELAKGNLRAGPGNVTPGGARFIRELKRTLRTLGYTH